MVRLLAARHGQTDWNAAGRFQGSTDVELNAAGLAQAEELARRIAAIPVDVVISSPLRRARATADIVAAALRRDVVVMEELAERGVGVFEGLTATEAETRHPELWKMVLTRQIHRGPPGGESILDVAMRVAAGLGRIRAAYDGSTVLLVAHGYVCRAIHGIVARPTDEEFFAFRLDNGRIAEYRLGGDGDALVGYR